MAQLVALRDKPHRAVILTTANAILQKMPPPDVIAGRGCRQSPATRST
jgi:transcription-repair coupling factor (superfamily II helicase)